MTEKSSDNALVFQRAAVGESAAYPACDEWTQEGDLKSLKESRRQRVLHLLEKERA